MIGQKIAPKFDLPILPSTTIGVLLERYPELEDVLIALAPPFKKLKIPALRKSVGKVASIQQIAAVGGIPIGELVAKLRAAVGQKAIAPEDGPTGAISYFSDQPDWFDDKNIVWSIKECDCDPDKMPIATVLQKAARLQPGTILELITNFLPAPGIDIMRRKGFMVWSVMEHPELIRTYISKPSP